MEIAALEAQITELVGHLNAANHRLLTLLAEFDRRKGWADCATQSCAHWLNWKCGIDIGAAREKVRVTHALESLPRISAAMERGELSYSKVRAITRVADAATEELLLSIALHGTAHHVETTVRCFRRVQQTEELSRSPSAGRPAGNVHLRRGWLTHHQSVAARGSRRAFREGARRSGRCGISGATRFRGNVPCQVERGRGVGRRRGSSHARRYADAQRAAR
jgi:hypothetical protein